MESSASLKTTDEMEYSDESDEQGEPEREPARTDSNPWSAGTDRRLGAGLTVTWIPKGLTPDGIHKTLHPVAPVVHDILPHTPLTGGGTGLSGNNSQPFPAAVRFE